MGKVAVPQTIDGFSVNGSLDITVEDIDNSTVVFNCSATGRPASSFTFYTNHNTKFSSSVITEAEANDTFGIITNYHEKSLTLTDCAETGTYTCGADNEVLTSMSEEVKVYVKCKYTMCFLLKAKK